MVLGVLKDPTPKAVNLSWLTDRPADERRAAPRSVADISLNL